LNYWSSEKVSTTIHELTQGPAGPVLRDCIATLRQVARYHLPTAIDRRLLYLSENKERLSQDEREELAALVEFAEDRTIEKVTAQATLKRLAELFPQLVNAGA
jgi:hypothetical protein